MAETYSGEFYCVKCKAKRRPPARYASTRRAPDGEGQVPVCGTNLNRILGRA